MRETIGPDIRLRGFNNLFEGNPDESSPIVSSYAFSGRGIESGKTYYFKNIYCYDAEGNKKYFGETDKVKL